MDFTYFLPIFIILGIIYLILGIAASKTIKTTSDYFLAGRKLGIIPVTFTLIATQLGGGMLLGTSQEAYSIGYYGILYTLGISLGFLLLGCFFAQRLQSLNVATTAQLFETKYHSPGLKKLASIFSIVTLCGLLIAQIIASKTVIMSLGITNELIFILFWAFIIFYTVLGGLKAVAITDLFQVVYILIIFGGTFFYCVKSGYTFPLFTAQQNFSTTAQLSMATIIPLLLMPALFSLIEQDLAQKLFAARTKKIAALSALFASLFIILFSFIPIYFGMQAKLLNLSIPLSASPIIPLISKLTSSLVATLALCGIIAAITSTADSLLCAISSNISQDFDLSFTGIRNNLTISKWVTFLTGAVAVIASYFVPFNIIKILISSYELSVSCLLIPLLVSYFKDNLNKYAALGSIICGLLGFIIFRIYPLPMMLPKEVAALLLSLIGYVIGNTIKKG